MTRKIVGRKSKAIAAVSKEQPKHSTKKAVWERVEEELEQEGVTLFDNQNVINEYLILPADITDVPSQELGKYLNTFTQQKMWTRTLIGRTSSTIREMSRELDELKAQVFSTLPAKMSVKEKELNFHTDEQARPTLDQMVIYEEKLRMLQDYIDNLVDGIFDISREISRRSEDWNEDKRSDNVSKKRR